ncbi:M56 family metallopeptidase [Hymenobacter cellulosilyticus]|uniref:M56 family metallopeptidase n=1 Tax=Hymenobacter cellulosilyticus TaxID=2932248 RepID=A0A8T9QBT5_9BACT|nr:M56 family metallopeptidase [Hymenobacter cellulosilyticus]UOQ73290.1 M56 family metallopeptidase [Hymenobacter cellulosilyticus]
MLYLLQANVALLLFSVLYYGLLRPLTFYSLNRGLLVFALLFAAGYPLVDVTSLLPLEKQAGPGLPAAVADWHSIALAWTPRATAATTVGRCLLIGYAAGAGLLLVRLSLQLAGLYGVHRRSRPAVVAGQVVRAVPEPVSAFSFWQTIYLNPRQYEPDELAVVLRHELVHVRQWHTLDTLLAHLGVVVFWCNPAAWLLRRAIAENLEFTTDQRLLSSGQVDSKQYQYSLLRASTRAVGNALVNHFHFLTLKTRIAMMNKQQSSRLQLAKYLLLAPLTLGLTLTFAGAKTAPATTALPQTAAGLPAEAVYYIDGKPATKAAVDQLNPNDIASMNALKGESVGQVLGTTGATEAILITTKQHENAPEVVALNRKLNGLVDLTGKLLLIGDKEVGRPEFQRQLAAQTQQVTPLSAKDAQQRFGARGKNGAVIIAAQ